MKRLAGFLLQWLIILPWLPLYLLHVILGWLTGLVGLALDNPVANAVVNLLDRIEAWSQK